MKPRQKRLVWVLAGVAALGVAATLVLNAFQSNLVFFFTPTQVAAGEAPSPLPRVGEVVAPHFLGRDDPLRAVAGASRGDDAVEGAREGVHEPDAGRGGEERGHRDRV